VHYLTLYVNEILKSIYTTSPSANSKIANFERNHIKWSWRLVSRTKPNAKYLFTLLWKWIKSFNNLWNRKYEQIRSM